MGRVESTLLHYFDGPISLHYDVFSNITMEPATTKNSIAHLLSAHASLVLPGTLALAHVETLRS